MEYLQPLLRTLFRAFLARMGTSGWLRWAAKCGYCSLGNCNVLLNGSGARSNGTDDASVQHDGYAAAEDDNFAGITFLNTEKRLTRRARRARSEVALSKILAVTALSMARSMLPMRAPSWRTKATRWPPASTTAML